MNPGPDHEAVQEMLAAAALGTLDDTELRWVVTHTGDCPDCAGAFQEYRDAAASLALVLPAARLDPARSARMKSRLMARVRLQKGGGIRPAWRAGWVGSLVAAGLAGLLLVHHSVHRPLDYGWLAAGILTLALVAVGVYARAQRRRVVELKGGRGRDVEVKKSR